MRAREIAMALGGNGTKRGGRYWCNCPVHGGTNHKLSIKDDDRWGDGIDVRCWSLGCDGGTIKAALRRMALMSGGPAERKLIDPKLAQLRATEERREQQKKRAWARRLWDRAEPNAEEVGRYLSEGRAIDLNRVGGVPACLRYQIGAVVPETDPKRYGFAMVAAVTDALGGLTAIHETFLNFSGTAKAGMERDKFIIGVMSGGAVRLTPITARLGIAEGIESALSASELYGVPCWAALSTSGMTGFMVPPSVRSVIIYADRDDMKANGKRPGTVAAETLAARLNQQRIECRIQYPAPGFADFNDELRARKGRADTVSAGQRVISNTCRATADSLHASAPLCPLKPNRLPDEQALHTSPEAEAGAERSAWAAKADIDHRSHGPARAEPKVRHYRCS